MSSNVGTILSMIFVSIFFLFGIDMINLQFLYTELDQKAVNIGYLLAKQGSASNIQLLEQQFNVDITCIDNCTPKFGDVMKFEVADSFQPFVISKGVMVVHVTRTTIIGYYD